jgi:hypothetical protein
METLAGWADSGAGESGGIGEARRDIESALAVVRAAIAKGVEWERKWAELVEDISRRTDQANNPDRLTVHWDGDVRLLNPSDTLSLQSEILQGFHFRLEWLGKNEIKIRAAEPPQPKVVSREWITKLRRTMAFGQHEETKQMLRELGIEVEP